MINKAAPAGPMMAASERRVRLALQAAGDIGAFEWDAAADRLCADECFWTLHGAITPEAAGRGSLLELVNGSDRERVAADMADAATGASGRLRCEYRLDGGDGDAVWLQLRGRRIDDGSGGGRLIGVVMDVTEQHDAEAALRKSEERFEAITNSIDQMIWSTRPDGFHDYYNKRWYEFTGVPDGSTDGEAWNDMFHPEDQERAWVRWRQSLETGEPYHIEYRLRHRSGEYRWVIGRAQCVRDEAGRIVRWYGSCTDIHDLKEAEAQRELITRELSHRIRNIFAVVSSLVMLPTRDQPEARPFAMSVQARILALAAAHEYVRPHGPASATEDGVQTVKGLLAQLALPYNEPDRPRILIEGDDMPVGLQAATALALIIHELSTNAVKYGSLSGGAGIVTITCTAVGERFRIAWRETGGPPVDGAPTRRGFGTTLSERVATLQLDAKPERIWHSDGLVVTIEMPAVRLTS